MPPALYADVIVPTSAGDWFTYRIPDHLTTDAAFGKRAVVSFGKSKLYAGLIVCIHTNPPPHYEAKYLEEILDPAPIITPLQFELWKWIARYYMCTLGEVMITALPGGLKLSSETVVMIHPEFETPDTLNDKEYLIYEALQIRKELTLHEISKILNIKNVQPVLNRLIKNKVIITEEDLKNRFKAKLETFVVAGPKINDKSSVEKVYDELKNKPQQETLLTAYLTLSRFFTPDPKLYVSKKDLLVKSGVSASTLQTLEKKQVLKTIRLAVDRVMFESGDSKLLKTLNDEQHQCLQAVWKAFSESKPVLLHGVTGSGKTEIFFYLIDSFLKKNQRVLYLLPEIALTYQMINRLKQHFGHKVLVYHSKFSENERVEIWNKCLASPDDSGFVIIGPRSALFLPHRQLGLIIVDEEHDNSYKQQDPAPRYNARDVALVLARQHKASVLLASATPSLETFYNAQNNKFLLIKLLTRFGNIELPKVEVVNIKECISQKNMHGIFSKPLLNEIALTLELKQQIILFQNRRGFAQYVECNVCNEVPFCQQCDVSLTYHKNIHSLKCHYCGYLSPMPKLCKKCGSPDLRLKGFGTEKIEDEITLFFPNARVGRMDADTTRNKNAYRQILYEFENQQIDILVGTQMITKGLNFDNVRLVGVINADNLLLYPDFRSLEKAYQLLTQVAGRPGRKGYQGKVIIQTTHPTHKVFQYINRVETDSFYNEMLEERKRFHYPPFSRLVQITLKHKQKEFIIKAAQTLTELLRSKIAHPVLGPESPLTEKLFGYFLQQILIKVSRSANFYTVQDLLKHQILEFRMRPESRGCKIVVNVDPL